jgi:hypothetical protein
MNQNMHAFSIDTFMTQHLQVFIFYLKITAITFKNLFSKATKSVILKLSTSQEKEHFYQKKNKINDKSNIYFLIIYP